MLQAWLSYGYIVLLAILVLAFILWRRRNPALAIAALVVGIPLWFGWEYARPTWTTGVIKGMEVRRSNPDARGNVTDIRYFFIRKAGSDRGLELINQDSWWWLKWNSSRILNDAMVAQSGNSEVTLMWNGWRSMLFSWYPNVIAIGPTGSWPGSVRALIFYGLSVVLWLSYFYAFFRLGRSSARVIETLPGDKKFIMALLEDDLDVLRARMRRRHPVALDCAATVFKIPVAVLQPIPSRSVIAL